MKGRKGKLDDRKNRRKRTITEGEVSEGSSWQKHYLDGVIEDMTRNTGVAWTEIGGSERGQDPWKEEN